MNRPWLLAAPLLLAALSLPAEAARPVCRLVTDAAGDEAELNAVRANGEPSLDILSADVATDARNLTTVVRVKRLGPVTNPALVWRYELAFTVRETTFFSTTTRFVDGDEAAIYVIDGEYDTEQGVSAYTGHRVGFATVVFDTRANEVRVTAPLSLFTDSPISGDVDLRGPLASTWTATGSKTAGTSTSGSVDFAGPGKPYRHQAPSCVRVGR
jgi:hypothetical protein